jgi:hypothetical protein
MIKCLKNTLLLLFILTILLIKGIVRPEKRGVESGYQSNRQWAWSYKDYTARESLGANFRVANSPLFVPKR